MAWRRTRSVIGIFLLCGVFNIQAVARVISRESGDRVRVEDFAYEMELSTYEWLIATKIGRRSPERFGLLTPATSYNPGENFQRERYKKWLAIIESKNNRRLMAQFLASQVADPWLQSLLPFTETKLKAPLENKLSRRQPAALTKERCPERSENFLQQRYATEIHTRLRWYSIALTFGEACARNELKRRFTIESFDQNHQVSGDSVLRTGKLLLIGFEPNRAAGLMQQLRSFGYSAAALPISNFANLRDRSQELKNALRAEANDPVLLISHSFGGAIVLDLLQEFSALIKEGKIIGWIAVDTQLQLGQPTHSVQMSRAPLPYWQNTRQVASDWNTSTNLQRIASADHERFLNEISLPVEKGFAAYTLVTKQNTEDLLSAVVRGAQNFSIPAAEWPAGLITLVQKRFQPLAEK